MYDVIKYMFHHGHLDRYERECGMLAMKARSWAVSVDRQAGQSYYLRRRFSSLYLSARTTVDSFQKGKIRDPII